jgi:hypothetical protein
MAFARLLFLVAYCGSVGIVSAPGLAQEAPSTAPALLRLREAIDPERRVSSLQLGGTLRGGQNARTGATLVSQGTIEVKVLPPSRFAQTSHLAYGSPRQTIGIRDGTAFDSSGGANDRSVRIQFARFSLALLGRTDSGLQLRLDSRTGDKTTLAFRVDELKETWHLDLDPGTGLPVRLRYPGRRMFPRPQNVAQTGVVVAPPVFADAEVAWSLEEHRDVNGVKLPRLIREVSKNVVFREMEWNQTLINPKFTDRDFDAGRRGFLRFSVRSDLPGATASAARLELLVTYARRYSARSASTGWMRVAARAGQSDATKTITRSASVAVTYVGASRRVTRPNECR